MPVYQSEAVRNNQKFRFFAAALVSEVTCALLRDTEIRQVHGLRCGPFLLFDGSGEVKHVVHLIRWNLNSCLCPCG